MIELKSLSQDQRDLIKIKVGGSKLYLKAISHHAAFNPITEKIIIDTDVKYKLEASTFVACVVSAIKKNDCGFTYSRDKNTYSLFNKTIINRDPASYRRIIKFLDLVEDLGYIELYKGFKDVEARRSMSACVVFTGKLLKLFDKGKIYKFGKVIHDNAVEVRDVDGNPIYGMDVDEVEKQVNSISDWLNKHSFEFGATERKFRLQRIYNEDLNSSGRFYFGELQTLKSERRKTYIIDKEPVTELDFSSQHFSIIATLQEYILPDNFKPYEIDISDIVSMKEGYSEAKARKINKLACMMLINSAKPTTSLKNVWQENINTITRLLDSGKFDEAKENPFYGASGKSNCKQIIDRLVKHNHYAVDYFFKQGGCWKLAQHLDSEIMFQILIKCKKLDIPLLPYHDSIVVRVSDKDAAYDVMVESWKAIMGNIDNCRIKIK